MAVLYDIESIPEALLSEVGGKARGLYKLKHLGFNVPEAFIVTDIQKDDDFSNVIDKYLQFGAGVVSVRSSATLEDGSDFSAAGQFSTFLNVEGGENVIEAVRNCVNSLYNERVIAYANDFLNGEMGTMTVVVQRMLEPRSAGVIFTKAPNRPGYSLVEAVPGLGENLVSGKVSAQQFRVRNNSIESIPEYPYISNSEAVRLAALGKKAEAAFGFPLDLEWAIDNSGKIWWLQARPITVIESVTVNELDCPLEARNAVYTTGNIGEMMPGAVTPLNISTNMYALDWGVMETYRRIGCSDGPLPPYSYIAPYYNHMFFNMTSMYAACHCIYGSTKETMDISICGKVLEGFPDSGMKNLRPLQKAANTIPFIKLIFGGESAKAGMEKVVSELSFDLLADIPNLYKQIIEKFDSLKWAQYYHYCASYYSGGQSNLLLLSADKAFDDKNELQAVIAGCMTQIDDIESASILSDMISLAAAIVNDEPSAKEFTAAQLQEYMQTAPAEVRNNLEIFMERHGHRGVREPEIMSQPWRVNPESFYNSLKSVIGMPETNHKEEKPWTDYLDELLIRFAPRKRKMITGMVMRARKGVCYREFTKSKVIYVLDQFRKAYRKLAELMVEAGMLPEQDDIFFLLQDEIGALIAGDRSLVKKAMARRRMFPIQQGLKFPYCQMGVPVPLSQKNDDPKALKLQGTPVSRGTAKGIARVIHTEEDAAALAQGEIMVVESTDIGWSPYYGKAAGMVTEIGSSLSHGIVVAREYALPAVVNVSNAMNLIHNGDTISIDGNTGKVLILKRK